MNGYTLHQGTVSGRAFVVIATGFFRPSDNRKTGNMIQTWILLRDISPVDGMLSALDSETVCRGCPFSAGRGCYVNLGQAPLGIWRAWHNGAYPELDPRDYRSAFRGRKVRFGAYGNPSLIPLAKLKAIAHASDGWTGYFHDWQEMHPSTRSAYNRYLMVSTETETSRLCAESKGLRYFHVSPKQPEGTVQCVADSHGIACADCQLCQGWNKPAKSVWIAPHGSGRKKAETQSLKS